MATETIESVMERFDPLSEDYQANPYPLYQQLREATPVFYAPAIDMWVVTRDEDIREIFRDVETYSAAIAQDCLIDLEPSAKRILAEGHFGAAPTMSNCEPPKHDRIRRQNLKAFSARRIAQLEGVVEEETTRLVDQMVQRKPADLVQDLAHPLPATMIFRLVGFPPDDYETLKQWTGNRLVFTWGRPEPEVQERVARGMVAYWNYCVEFVQKRVAEPQNDFTSDLIRAHREHPASIGIDEITNVAYGLSFAGHENLTSMTTNAVRQLLTHRDQWEELCANPEGIKNAVEECIRYDSSNPGWRRITTRAVNIGGVDVPARAKLLLLLGSANHDPGRFRDPEVFDVRRREAHDHVGFGKGIHFCLGAALVRLELRIVLEHLAQRLPSLRLVPDQQYVFTPNVAFRGPRQLWIDWD